MDAPRIKSDVGRSGRIPIGLAAILSLPAIALLAFAIWNVLVPPDRVSPIPAGGESPQPAIAFRVAGPSMSPTLWGPHRIANCEHCGWSHRIHMQPDPTKRSLRCFRCGATLLSVSQEVYPGDTIDVDTSAYAQASPRRGDLVAIRTSRGGLQVKRVVGLPGELVKIDQHGCVRVDGERLQAEPSSDWDRSVEVYHMRNTTRQSLHRWRAVNASATGAPQVLGDLEIAEVMVVDTDVMRRGLTLVYDHRNTEVITPESPSGMRDRVMDNDPANAALTRELFPVDQLRVSIVIETKADISIRMAMHAVASQHVMTAEVPAGRTRVRVMLRGDELWQQIGESQHWQPCVRVDVDRDLGRAISAVSPVAVSLRGNGPCQLSHLSISRAPRFDPPFHLRDRWRHGVQVGERRLIVFGDNPPNSQDSRNAPEGIPISSVVGQIRKHTPRREE